MARAALCLRCDRPCGASALFCARCIAAMGVAAYDLTDDRHGDPEALPNIQT